MKDHAKMSRRLAGLVHTRLPEIGLGQISDRRPNDRRKRWPLVALLQMTVAGLIAGVKSCAEAEALSAELSPSARRLLGLGRRVPDTTLRRVLTQLDPDELRAGLQRQVQRAFRRKALVPEGLPFGVVALDGKYTRLDAWDDQYSQRQWEGKPGESVAHGMARTMTCSLVSSRAKVCLDAVPIPPATNEMGFFPVAFAGLLAAYGQGGWFRVVTADAGSCSEANGAQVVAAGRDYLFGLKGTQPTLLAEARAQLADRLAVTANAQTEDLRKPYVVRRRLYLSDELVGFAWSHLRTVLRVETEVVSLETGEVLLQDEDDVNRYYLSSLPLEALTPEQWLCLVRRHWGVENDCHHTWDTAFAEDDRPWLTTHPQGMLVVLLLRRIAYNLLALFRSVTQRAEENRAVPWKTLLRWVRDMLVALRDADWEGLRPRRGHAALS